MAPWPGKFDLITSFAVVVKQTAQPLSGSLLSYGVGVFCHLIFRKFAVGFLFHFRQLNPGAQGVAVKRPALPACLSFTVDFCSVTAEVVDRFLVAHNVHQFQIVRGEHEPVKIFPVDFLPVAAFHGLD